VDAQTLKLSTVVGTGAKGYHGDGGPANRAKLDNPSGLAIDRDGNLYISEFVNNRIRRVDAINKVITTIGGNGLPHRVDVMM
jgi:DNA-binding beta-propeller fold protein YncE